MVRRSSFPPAAGLVLAAALVSVSGFAAADVVTGGAQVGQWKTWVLGSAAEIAVPAPPADSSDQTKKELDELRQLQAQRSPVTDTAIQYYFAVPATQRWHDMALTVVRAEKANGNRQLRLETIVHTAITDAVIATWAAKYQYNHKTPSQLAPDVTVVATVGGPPATTEPSYPSEDAAIAGAASGILTALYPNEANDVKAMATEIQETRLAMGANYRSDLDAGFALGQAVAQKALARAATDGSDAVWTGAVPTGPGYWVLAPGTQPLEPLEGTWKPWIMTSGSQFRAGPPPAFGTPEFLADIATVKQLSSNPTPSQRAIAVNFAADAFHAFYDPIYTLVQNERLSTPREARVLGLLSATLQDAFIASHDTKYTYWRLRPNMADPTIMPYIAQPNHPSYPSNAAVASSAEAEVMATLFPEAAAQFHSMAESSGQSRVYGGIHSPIDEHTGSAMGKSLAALALQRDQLSGP
jgi:membrane-associated phospholipid phosphatase